MPHCSRRPPTLRTGGSVTALRIQWHPAVAHPFASEVLFNANNDYRYSSAAHVEAPGGWLLDTKLVRDSEEDIAALFSDVVANDVSTKQSLMERLRRAIPAMANVTILDVLLNADRKGFVAFGNGRGPLLPVAAMGDGGRLTFHVARRTSHVARRTSLLALGERSVLTRSGSPRRPTGSGSSYVESTSFKYTSSASLAARTAISPRLGSPRSRCGRRPAGSS